MFDKPIISNPSSTEEVFNKAGLADEGITLWIPVLSPFCQVPLAVKQCWSISKGPVAASWKERFYTVIKSVLMSIFNETGQFSKINCANGNTPNNTNAITLEAWSSFRFSLASLFLFVQQLKEKSLTDLTRATLMHHHG